MQTQTDMRLMLDIERRLTIIEWRLNGLERERANVKQQIDVMSILKGPWGKGILILALLAAQVPMKDVLMFVFK